MKEETIKKSKGNSKPIGLVILVIVIVLLVLWWTDNLGFSGVSANDEYQSVFLTNNQVYFGKLSKVNSQYPVLTDVFYLQIRQTLQPRDQEAPAATNVNLVKLGGEIHGPTDRMVINRDHILFYENLKSDSQVVKAILEFEESNQ